MGGGRRGYQVSSFIVDLFLYLRRCLVLNQSKLSQRGWLAVEISGSISLHLMLHPPPSTGVTIMHSCVQLSAWVLGIQTQVLTLVLQVLLPTEPSS